MDDDVKVLVAAATPTEVLALQLGRAAAAAAGAEAHLQGHLVTPEQWQRFSAVLAPLARLLAEQALALGPEALTDDDLDEVAQRLGASLVAEVFGAPPQAC